MRDDATESSKIEVRDADLEGVAEFPRSRYRARTARR